MPYRLYAATRPGWSAAPVDFESADKVLECALKMIKRDPEAAVLYRFYEIATSGSRSLPRDFACLSDIDAMMHAGSMIKTEGSVEIWRGGRLIGEIGQRFSRWATAQASKVHPSPKPTVLN